MKRFLDRAIQREGLAFYLSLLWDRVAFHLFYHHVYRRAFKGYGSDIRWGRDFRRRLIPRSVRISCPEMISIGDGCRFDEGVYLQCHRSGGGIQIEDGCRLNAHTHIQAYDTISIGRKVLFAPFCLVASGNHDYSDPAEAIMDRDSRPGGAISIGAGTWVGHSAKILGGATLGTQSVVAAGAVVTKHFEDRSLVAGIPARLIKRIE